MEGYHYSLLRKERIINQVLYDLISSILTKERVDKGVIQACLEVDFFEINHVLVQGCRDNLSAGSTVIIGKKIIADLDEALFILRVCRELKVQNNCQFSHPYNEYIVLYLAIVEVVDCLVDLNFKEGVGNTALFYVDSKKKALELIQKGLDVNSRNRYQETALFYANSTEVAEILIESGADINVRNYFGSTAFLHFLKRCQPQKQSLQASSDLKVIATFFESYFTSLLYQSRDLSIMPDLIKLLIKSGADINVKDDYGRAAVFYSKSAVALGIIKELGLSLDERDNEGNTALFYAVSDSSTSLIRALLGHGANIDLRGEGNRTLLFGVRDVETAKILVSAGIDVNAKDDRGVTALDYYLEMINKRIKLVDGVFMPLCTMGNYLDGSDVYECQQLVAIEEITIFLISLGIAYNKNNACNKVVKAWESLLEYAAKEMVSVFQCQSDNPQDKLIRKDLSVLNLSGLSNLYIESANNHVLHDFYTIFKNVLVDYIGKKQQEQLAMADQSKQMRSFFALFSRSIPYDVCSIIVKNLAPADIASICMAVCKQGNVNRLGANMPHITALHGAVSNINMRR